jgi:predicted RNA binding protein YcfA (HicA-like mRNA interferase family)
MSSMWTCLGGLGETDMKVREVIALIEADGWYLVRTRGDHRQYKHPTKPGRVTVSGHRNDEVHPKTLTSILTQAGLRGRNP